MAPAPHAEVTLDLARRRLRLSAMLGRGDGAFEAPHHRKAPRRWVEWLPGAILGLVMLALTAGGVIAGVESHNALTDGQEPDRIEALRPIVLPTAQAGVWVHGTDDAT